MSPLPSDEALQRHFAEELAVFARRMLLERQDLTHRIAIEAGCGWRLASAIYDQRKRGWPIISELDGAGVAHYRLPPGWYPEKDETPEPGKNGGSYES